MRLVLALRGVTPFESLADGSGMNLQLGCDVCDEDSALVKCCDHGKALLSDHVYLLSLARINYILNAI